MKLNCFRTELEREGIVPTCVHVRMRYSCVSYLSNCAKNTVFQQIKYPLSPAEVTGAESTL